MLNQLKSAIARFKTETRASVSVEAVLVLPLLFWAITATFVFFDVYKVQNATYRANYTVSDMLSRRAFDVDPAYANGLFKVFRYMTKATSTNSWIRISVINCLDDCGEDDRKLAFSWSHGVNGAVDHTDADLPGLDNIIPLFSSGDQLILVETSTEYVPLFSESITHFGARTIKTNVVTRPRFAPQLGWNNEYVDDENVEDDVDGDGG